MQNNNKIISSFPSRSLWADYYKKYRKTLVGKLNSSFCFADREDAVEEAFNKLMNKKPVEAYGDKMPDTEVRWFWALYWQARAFLSHQNERSELHKKYVEKKAKELANTFASGCQGLFMDRTGYSAPFLKALNAFRLDQHISRRNLGIYIDAALTRIPAKKIAEKYQVTENNIYVIKFRVEKLLNKYGKSYFRDAIFEMP